MAKSILDIVIRMVKQGDADKDTVRALVNIKGGITQAMGVMAALAGVGYTLNRAYQGTVKVFADYAAQVRDTQRLTGASAEDTSRLIQLADDLTISYESLQKSLWFASKNGVEVNIKSLSALAGQYTALESPMARAEFLAENFGKSGAEMGKLLERGADGVLALAAAVQSSLVLTDAQIAKARELEIAQDQLNDTWTAYKINVGSQWTPVMVDALNVTNDTIRAQEILAEQGLRNVPVYTAQYQAALQLAQGEREAAAALALTAQGANTSAAETDALTGSTENMLASTRAYIDALHALEQARRNKLAETQAQEMAEVASTARLTGLAILYMGQTTQQAAQVSKGTGALMARSIAPAEAAAISAATELAYMVEQLWNAKRMAGSAWTYSFIIKVTGRVPEFPGGGGGMFSGGAITPGGGFFSGSMLAAGNAAGGPLSADITAVGEKGEEGVFRLPGGKYMVVPHEAWTWMKKVGIVANRQLAIGGDFGGGGGFGITPTSTRGGGGRPGDRDAEDPTRGGSAGRDADSASIGTLSGGTSGASVDVASVINPLEQQTQSASQAAVVMAEATRFQSLQAQRQTDATIEGNAAIVAKLEQLKQGMDRLPEAMQDAVKVVI